MAELALYDDQRHALAREFDGVRMPELVRREAAPDSRASSGWRGLLLAWGSARHVLVLGLAQELEQRRAAGRRGAQIEGCVPSARTLRRRA